MNSVIEFFNLASLQTLGYTLLHSLWQAGAVLMLVTITLRFIPIKLSNTRYAIASSSLLIILSLSIGTFFYLFSNMKIFPLATSFSVANQSQISVSVRTFSVATIYLDTVKYFIHSNIPFFVMIWIAGTLIFSLRVLSGLIYVGKLRGEAILIHTEWSQRIQVLAQHLRIGRMVSLAESKYIQAPIVIGYLKPMILIPIGICTALSTEQLETIFLHELMHVRRKDYLVNIMQSFLEAIFFFNPFVWVISGIMKREREHCCDDAVVQLHGNALDYAYALASLEEVRLSKAGLSISFAENKNQLLNRIKRIMEKSVRNYSGRERIIPALLLVIGLICTSWISTQTGRNESEFYRADNQTVASDTTKKNKKNKKNKKVTTDSSKEISIIREDEKSDADREEKFKREEDDMKLYGGLAPLPLEDFDIDIDVPVVPDIDAMIPPIPDLNIMLDDFEIPSFEWRNEKEWEEFSKEFEEKFKSKFGDFYKTHERDIERIMEEAQQKINGKLDEDWAKKMQDFATKQQALAETQAKNWERHADLMSRREEHVKNLEEDRRHWEERQRDHIQEFEKNHERFEKRMKAFEENTKRFEAELQKELIKDGYLDKDEKLNTMHWHNGSIEINGKKIKASDEKKYNEIHKKYFKENKEFDAVE